MTHPKELKDKSLNRLTSQEKNISNHFINRFHGSNYMTKDPISSQKDIPTTKNVFGNNSKIRFPSSLTQVIPSIIEEFFRYLINYDGKGMDIIQFEHLCRNIFNPKNIKVEWDLNGNLVTQNGIVLTFLFLYLQKFSTYCQINDVFQASFTIEKINELTTLPFIWISTDCIQEDSNLDLPNFLTEQNILDSKKTIKFLNEHLSPFCSSSEREFMMKICISQVEMLERNLTIAAKVNKIPKFKKIWEKFSAFTQEIKKNDKETENLLQSIFPKANEILCTNNFEKLKMKIENLNFNTNIFHTQVPKDYFPTFLYQYIKLPRSKRTRWIIYMYTSLTLQYTFWNYFYSLKIYKSLSYMYYMAAKLNYSSLVKMEIQKLIIKLILSLEEKEKFYQIIYNDLFHKNIGSYS